MSPTLIGAVTLETHKEDDDFFGYHVRLDSPGILYVRRLTLADNSGYLVSEHPHNLVCIGRLTITATPYPPRSLFAWSSAEEALHAYLTTDPTTPDVWSFIPLSPEEVHGSILALLG